MTLAPVEITIARPGNWEDIDLMSPEAIEHAGEKLVADLRSFGASTETARLLLARSLYRVSEDRRPLAMGLVVTLGGPETMDIELDESAGEPITLFIGTGIRVRSVKQVDLPGDVRAPMLSVQYLIRTEVGLVVMTFTTPSGVAQGTEEWEELFATMASTAALTLAN